MRPWLDSYLDWRLANNIVRIDSEFAIVGDGYAGTVDAELACGKEHELYLVDFKTQQIRGGEPVFYFSWCVQLAAYRRGIKYDRGSPKCGYSGHQCASVIIDSGESHSIHVREWSEPELMEGWEVFQACKVIWSSMAGPGKGYRP